MRQIALIAVGIVALLHLYFMVLEMFLWTKPAGLKAFGQSPEQAEASKVLAANQGLYNGFLAAGLIWGALTNEFHIMLFFLTCVIAAGIFGGLTASRKILYIQALPALIALILLHLP
jgi:putative membrane protein